MSIGYWECCGSTSSANYPLISMTLTSPGQLSSISFTAFASSPDIVSSHLVFTAAQYRAYSHQKTSSGGRHSFGPFAPLSGLRSWLRQPGED